MRSACKYIAFEHTHTRTHITLTERGFTSEHTSTYCYCTLHVRLPLLRVCVTFITFIVQKGSAQLMQSCDLSGAALALLRLRLRSKAVARVVVSFQFSPRSPPPEHCAAPTTDALLDGIVRRVRDSLCIGPTVAVTWSERVVGETPLPSPSSHTNTVKSHMPSRNAGRLSAMPPSARRRRREPREP